MNPLLQNEVRRLFSCREHNHLDLGDGCLSGNILDGMYAEIKKGELAYSLADERVGTARYDMNGFHPKHLRLPEWHQKPKHEHKYVCECGEMK